jgi:Peptidase family M48
VQFNAGLLAATDWLSQAMIADWAGHEGCLNEYSDYLAGLVDHNSRRMKHGRDRKHVNDFEAYAATTRGQCEGAMTNDLDRGRQEELRVEILDAITVTVLLHEIGHHVLGHVDVAARDEKPFVRRLLELDADRWAVSTAVNSHYEIRTAVPLFLFLASTGGGTIEDEIRSSHPSGLRRMRDLLIQTRALLDSRDAERAHMLDASIDDLNRSVR